MNIQKAAVGQRVLIDGGFGPVEGTISEVSSQYVCVEANGRIRLNNDGEECDPNGVASTYTFNVMFGPGPWKILATVQEEHQ